MSDIEKQSPYKRGILQGKVALVTGGGSGINFGIARWLGYHGANLALMGRRQEVTNLAIVLIMKVLEGACKELENAYGCRAVAVQGLILSKALS